MVCSIRGPAGILVKKEEPKVKQEDRKDEIQTRSAKQMIAESMGSLFAPEVEIIDTQDTSADFTGLCPVSSFGG